LVIAAAGLRAAADNVASCTEEGASSVQASCLNSCHAPAPTFALLLAPTVALLLACCCRAEEQRLEVSPAAQWKLHPAYCFLLPASTRSWLLIGVSHSLLSGACNVMESNGVLLLLLLLLLLLQG
jgi:hypothetical protein